MEANKWLDDQLAQLDPPAGWEANTAAAVRRHHARRQEEWRRGPGSWWKLAMAAAVLLALVLLPATRSLAQRLWRQLTVGRIEVARIDLDLLPEGSSLRAKILQHPGKMTPVEDAESARARAGFAPRLPYAGVLNGAPRLSVMGPTAFGMVLKLEDLRQLLRNAGMDERSAPVEWEGARIVLQTSGMVMAEWTDSDTMLLQWPPFRMALPEGFDLRKFTGLLLRGLKMPAAQAERLAERMAATPAWMLPIDSTDHVEIRPVALRSGEGTLVYDLNEEHPERIERVTLIWSASDRVYMLSGPMNDSMAIATANAIQ